MADESFEGQDVEEPLFLAVLKDCVEALARHDVPYAAMGGIASSILGRDRWTHDIDLFVAPGDAGRALEALADAAFRTQRTNENWLFKGIKDGVLVDVLFKAKGDLTLDAEMRARATSREFKGQPLRVLAPEDLLVIKALVHDEDTPRHWHDALGLIAAGDLDWEYLLRRAVYGPRRVLSLLAYAGSVDLLVPGHVVRALFDRIYPTEKGTG
jgi:hypothetical protein